MSFFMMNPQEIETLMKHCSLQTEDGSDTDVTILLAKYFESKKKELTLGYTNNSTMATQLFLPYFSGVEEFKKVFCSIHHEKILELSKCIEDSNYTLDELLTTLLSEKKDSTQVQLKAVIITLQKQYSKILEMCDTRMYFSNQFEGLLHVYENIYFDITVFFTNRANRRMQRISSMELYPLARQIKEYDFTYQYPVVETSVFLIRQAIEVHVKNALGIKKTGNNNKQEIGIAQLIQFLKNRISDNDMAIGINVDILQLINRWTNEYIHTGSYNCPYWYIEIIIDYLSNFFFVPEEIFGLYPVETYYSNRSIFIEKSYFIASKKNTDESPEISKNDARIADALNQSNGDGVIAVTKKDIEAINNWVKQEGRKKRQLNL